MNHIFFRRAATAALLGAVLCGGAGVAQAQTPLPAVQKVGDVEVLTGGIGKDESTAFEAESRNWPLALEFAVGSGGQRAQFASDVQVTLRDAASRNVLQTTAAGPFLLLRVPPGSYTVEAVLQGAAQRRQVAVKQGASTKVMLSWPAAAGDPKP